MNIKLKIPILIVLMIGAISVAIIIGLSVVDLLRGRPGDFPRLLDATLLLGAAVALFPIISVSKLARIIFEESFRNPFKDTIIEIKKIDGKEEYHVKTSD